MKNMLNAIFLAALVFLTSLSAFSAQQTYISLESAQTWQSQNDQRIPGDTGDKFSIADFDKGPFFTYRAYVGHLWGDRHELRALYAPLAIQAKGEFDRTIQYKGGTFAADTPTTIDYVFNSYRLTYAYHFQSTGSWQWALGFTGKVRDAEVRVRQGALDEKKSNVGFVPLAHARAAWGFAPNWSLAFDFDGLAAPQGRAVDLGIFLKREWSGPGLSLFAGYRTVEGGADNDEVYNFAWFHSATVGFEYRR